jgi:UDP-glucose:(heptosyl)LPS alpha-1,3-glucosyltransferase
MKAYLSFPGCHRRGGVERVILESANFLSSRGHQVSVISAEINAESLASEVSQCIVPAHGFHKLSRLNVFRRAASQKLLQMRDVSNCVHGAFGVVCPPDSVLWVQSVHAEWLRISRSTRSFTGRIKQRLNPFHPYVLRLERDYYSGRQYRKLIALTPRVRQELMDHYQVPADDIAVLPNGYNPAEFNPPRRDGQRDKVRADLGYGPDDTVLVFVANELERKGFFPLIEALSALKEHQVKLLVVGRVSIRNEWLQARKMESQVQFVGPSADVGRYYAASDYFVLPTYYEAWGLVIVEALASGLPVLTSRLAGAAAAVQEGRTGLLLEDPRDPKEIAQKLDQLFRLSHPTPEEISRTVASYQWSKILLQYESILAQHCS